MTKKSLFWLRLAAVAAFSFSGTLAGLAYTLEEECDFAEALAADWRMPDFASKVLDELELKDPANKPNLIPSRVLILAAMNKLTNAEALVKSLPAGESTDAARIALAKAYFRAGQPQKAKEIYADYFKGHAEPPKNPIALKAFRTACSEFGGMMKAAGDELAAVQAGRLFLKTKPDEEVADAIRCDMAVLLLEGVKKHPDQKENLLKEAEGLCNAVMGHGVSLPWGQALVAEANVKLERGDRAGAQKLIKENLDVLKPLDESLMEMHRLSESPRAGILMMNAQINEQDGKAATAKKDYEAALKAYSRAIGDYYNVFLVYGDSDYGMPAGAKFNELKKTIEDAPFKKHVKVDLTMEQQEKVLAHSYRLADQKMRGHEFDKAIPEYLKVLRDYPESDRSVRALGALLRCYAESDDKLMVKATATYIGERFHKRAFAADLIRGLGKFYLDKKDEGMFYFVCNTYLDSFPSDPNACAVLLTMATLKLATNDYAGSSVYLERIVNNAHCTNEASYSKALGQLASIYLTESNFVHAAELYKQYAAELPAGIEKLSAQAKYADSLRLSGGHADALPIYELVVQQIKDPNAQLLTTTTGDVAVRAKDTLERCMFYQGICYSRMTNDVAANRQKATAAYDSFLKQYPNSTNYAPKALAGRGQVFLLMDNFDEASKVFTELSQKYPNSPEGKNALISLVQSALEIKRLDQARKAFAQMVQSANPTTLQYLQMGQLWLDNADLDKSLYSEAAQAFAKVAASSTTDGNILQPALFGLGKAQFENKKFKEAADALDKLVAKYERTPYFFDAKLILSACYRELGKFDDAMAALGELMNQPSSTPAQKMEAQYEIEQLQEKQGKKSEAFGSCVRNVELAAIGHETRPEILSWLGKILLDGVRLGNEIGKYDDVIPMCDQYEILFPKGANLERVRKAKSEAVSKAASGPATTPPAAPPAGAKTK